MTNNDEMIERINELLLEIKDLKNQLHLQSKPIYTNKEMMELLKVSSITLKKWRDRGCLGYTQVGSTYFYSPEDIKEFMDKNHCEASAYS